MRCRALFVPVPGIVRGYSLIRDDEVHVTQVQGAAPVLPRTPNRLDPIPGRRSLDDQTLAMIVSLASEVTILRARLDAAERLLTAANIFAPDAVDNFTPDAAAQAARERQRQHSMAKIFRPLREAAAIDLATLSSPEKVQP